MRWRAERWMKLRHMPAAIRHSPLFVLRHAPQMLAHTFRGSTWRSALGLESDRETFRRYREIRRREREYVADADTELTSPVAADSPIPVFRTARTRSPAR
jgi:hypothetical protein